MAPVPGGIGAVFLLLRTKSLLTGRTHIVTRAAWAAAGAAESAMMQRIVLGLLVSRKRRIKSRFRLALDGQALGVKSADLRGQSIDGRDVILLDSGS